MEPFLEADRWRKKLSYSDLEPYGTTWYHMEPYGTLTRGKRRPKKLSYSDLEPYGTIWNHMEPFLEADE